MTRKMLAFDINCAEGVGAPRRKVGTWSAIILAGLAAAGCSAVGDEPRSPGLGGTGNTSAQLPCEVDTLFAKRCRDCHDKVPLFTAPMALVTHQDFHKKSAKFPSETVYQRVLARLLDKAAPMPPAPYTIEPQERDQLVQWLQSGAPDGKACSGTGGTGSGTGGTGGGTGGSTGGTAGSGGSSAGSGGSSAGSGGSAGGTTTSCTPYPILAHNQATPGDSSAFAVPGNSQFYECFNFKVPWTKKVHGITFSHIEGNPKVIHHWLLYRTDTPSADGSHERCVGVHGDAELISGWAPGGSKWIMPPGVGMDLPGPGGNLILEVHYANTGATAQTDRSGVEICATEQLQPNTATVSWLGTEVAINIPPNSPSTAAGECNPGHTAPIHILRTWPHMHKLGRHMKTEIRRSSGMIEILDDVPFDFNNQIGYDKTAKNIKLMPGDKIKTTCSYQNTTGAAVGFGPQTEAEMCYNFILAYPARALVKPGLSLMRNACIDFASF